LPFIFSQKIGKGGRIRQAYIMKVASVMQISSFIPDFAWVSDLNGRRVSADAYAGFINAAIVLPQGVAFATIAGLPPEYGLYTAMITAIVAAIFGSSMIMISGPTTAISAVGWPFKRYPPPSCESHRLGV